MTLPAPLGLGPALDALQKSYPGGEPPRSFWTSTSGDAAQRGAKAVP